MPWRDPHKRPHGRLVHTQSANTRSAVPKLSLRGAEARVIQIIIDCSNWLDAGNGKRLKTRHFESQNRDLAYHISRAVWWGTLEPRRDCSHQEDESMHSLTGRV